MSQTSGGDKWWRCTNSACLSSSTFLLSVGIKFKVCPLCATAQPSQEATSQRSKLGQEVAESLQRPPLHPEADLVERASNLELSTPNISEIRTQGSLENASQTSPTSHNVPQVQFFPEGNVTSAEPHSSQQKPSNDPPSAPGEKPTLGPPGETPKPDSCSPGKKVTGKNPTPGPPRENPTPGPPRENPTPGPPRENPTSGPSREKPTPTPPGETPKQERGPPGKLHTPNNNDPSGKNYIPGTTDNSAHQSNHEASGVRNKDSHPTGNPKVSCFCEFMLCVIDNL